MRTIPAGSSCYVNHGYSSSQSLAPSNVFLNVNSDRDASAKKLSRNESFERLKENISKSCNSKLMKRRLPFLVWLPTMTLVTAVQDFLAGFTVAITAIPQGIAYGAVAGVPVEVKFALLCLFWVFLWTWIVSSAFLVWVIRSLRRSHCLRIPGISGPSVGWTHGRNGPHDKWVCSARRSPLRNCAVLLDRVHWTSGWIFESRYTWCIWQGMTLSINDYNWFIGFLVELISGPVISGFCSAAATTVIFSQIKIILGLKFRGSSFPKVIAGIFNHWKSINVWDALLGLSFILLLLFLKVKPKLAHFLNCESKRLLCL